MRALSDHDCLQPAPLAALTPAAMAEDWASALRGALFGRKQQAAPRDFWLSDSRCAPRSFPPVLASDAFPRQLHGVLRLRPAVYASRATAPLSRMRPHLLLEVYVQVAGVGDAAWRPCARVQLLCAPDAACAQAAARRCLRAHATACRTAWLRSGFAAALRRFDATLGLTFACGARRPPSAHVWAARCNAVGGKPASRRRSCAA